MRPIILFSVLLLLACARETAGGAGDVHRIIDEHNDRITRAYASGDVDALSMHFAEDAWQMPPNAPPLVGRDAIREFWGRAVQWGDWAFTFEAQDVTVSGPMAVERGRYELSFTAGPEAPPTLPSFRDRGNYLVHWQRDADGEWRIVADAPVSELPLPGSMPPAE